MVAAVKGREQWAIRDTNADGTDEDDDVRTNGDDDGADDGRV